MLTTENISYVSDACTNGGTDNAALKYAEKNRKMTTSTFINRLLMFLTNYLMKFI